MKRRATSQKGIIMKKQYEIDMVNEKVYVDPQFVKNAGQLGAPEFTIFMELKNTLTGFSFEVKNLNESCKITYSDLTYETMEAFINFYEKEECRATSIEEFKKIRAESIFKKAPYSFVKSWFLSKYKDAYNKSNFATKKDTKKSEVIKGLNNSATTVSQASN